MNLVENHYNGDLSSYILYATGAIILYFISYQHMMAWLPILAPAWALSLLPIALWFYFYPDTIYTKPSMMENRVNG